MRIRALLSVAAAFALVGPTAAAPRKAPGKAKAPAAVRTAALDITGMH